jgi:anti-sigma-K factor RskA
VKWDSPEDRSAAAGEYVLGTLEAGERAEVEQRLAVDAALRADVAFWQDRLLGLAVRATPVEPSSGVWPRIEQAVADAAPAARADERTRAQSPTAAPARPRAPAPAGTPWWQRLGLWQGVSGLALAACLVLASLLVLRVEPVQAPRFVAVLQSPDSATPGWIVEARADAANLRLVPIVAGAAVPSGKSLQFWTKPRDASGPTSLGLVRAGQTAEIPLSQLPGQLGEEQLFEITLEPEAGSPIGRPTGPVLYIGRTVRL